VIVVSYLDKNEVTNEFYQRNDIWHLWGDVNKVSPGSGYIYSDGDKRCIWLHYQAKWVGRFKRLFVLSDGSPDQFKSCFAMNEMTFLCTGATALPNLVEVVHTIAPTAQFKCICDGGGNDTKAFLKKNELANNIRVTNAWEIYLALRDMPELQHRQTTVANRFCLSERFVRYVTYEKLLTPAMTAHLDNIVCIREPPYDKTAREIKGIRDIY